MNSYYNYITDLLTLISSHTDGKTFGPTGTGKRCLVWVNLTVIKLWLNFTFWSSSLTKLVP